MTTIGTTTGTTTTVTKTTDVAADGGQERTEVRWPFLRSARGRIVGWLLLVVAIALAGSIAATGEVLSVQADNIASDALTHEAQSFHAYADSSRGQRATSVRELLHRYLEDSVPDSGETYFSMVDGRPDLRSAVTPPARLDTDDAFVREIAAARAPVSGWWRSTRGRVRYGVIPVTVAGDSSRGALVIIQFRDVQARPLLDAWRVFAIVAVLALGLAGLVSWLVAGWVLEPVRLVRQTAEQISETDLHRRIDVAGHDDVARLAATFNKMLDRLETAFAVQRQFIDDAGHELRTPITVVRGHLELMGEDPQDREETMTLVMDELDRMRRIVEELLDLARAERPDFVRRAPVRLADLTIDAIAHARVLAPRRWGVDEVADATVLVDGQRLTQALMQLLVNAVTHTEEHDTIAVGSRVRDGRLLLWVRDSGRGVAPADRVHVFERFARGRGARSGGVGIGLAVVSLIAQAHGGEARLDDDGGVGATFVLDLPAVPAPDVAGSSSLTGGEW